MYAPVFLQTENELNKVLRKQKKSKQELAILFTSLWDSYSQELVTKLKFRELTLTLYPIPDEEKEHRVPLYVVDSYTMPHAFVIYQTSKLPHLVHLKKMQVTSMDYLPIVYEELGL